MNFKIELGSLPVVLFIVFLVLKLCKVISWSWWWVTCPLWITAAVCLAIFLIVLIIAFIDNLIH